MNYTHPLGIQITPSNFEIDSGGILDLLIHGDKNLNATKSAMPSQT